MLNILLPISSNFPIVSTYLWEIQEQYFGKLLDYLRTILGDCCSSYGCQCSWSLEHLWVSLTKLWKPYKFDNVSGLDMANSHLDMSNCQLLKTVESLFCLLSIYILCFLSCWISINKTERKTCLPLYRLPQLIKNFPSVTDTNLHKLLIWATKFCAIKIDKKISKSL